jgi:hypothetical protein
VAGADDGLLPTLPRGPLDQLCWCGDPASPPILCTFLDLVDHDILTLINHLMQFFLFLADLNAKTLAIGAQKMVAVSMPDRDPTTRRCHDIVLHFGPLISF